jgi:alpha-mannosidase
MNNHYTRKRITPLILLCLLVTLSAVSQPVMDGASYAIQGFVAQLQTLFLQGYEKSVAGETIGYHSANEYVNDALLVRAVDGKGRIEWMTEDAPAQAKESVLTYAWMFGLSGSKGVHRFDLFVDGRPTLTFTTATDSTKKVLKFEGKEGGQLTFVVTKVDQFGDLFGYCFLQIHSDLVQLGKPLALKVVGAAEGSTAWYMTFKHSLEPKVRIEALPLLVAHGDSALQLIKVGIEHYGAPTAFDVFTDPLHRMSKSVGWGVTTVMLPVPAVSYTERQPLVIESGGKIEREDTVELNPVHKRIFYLLPHSHTDIGYSDYQPVVEQDHIRYIDEAIRLAEKTESYPEGARFKWNIEVLWPLESYFKQADEVKRELLVKAIRKGWIGLTGLYANVLTGLCRPEELIHATDYARTLESRYGVPIHTAMISDIPAYTSSTVTALSLAGIRYFSSGPNYMPTTADGGDRIGYALKTWGDKPFYWESRSKQHRVLFWMAGRGYSWFHGLNMGRLRDASLSTICNYLEELDKKGYPYDMVQVRYTMGDNASPDSDLADCVEAWNKKYLSPKMVIATAQNMFETFEKKYGKQLPVYQGDFTPYWEDGAASTAKELAVNRNAAEKLIQAAALNAMADPAVFDSSAFYSAWRNVVLFDEHTWGASNSISDPDSPNVKSQWEYKKAFEADGDKKAETLLDKAERKIAGPVNGTIVDVINTTSWPRSDLVIIPEKFSKSRNEASNTQGVQLASQRLSTGELAVLVKDVPPFGVERILLRNNPRHRAAPDLWAGNGKIDNGTISLTLDETTGAIKSLLWNNEEFVDTTRGFGLNQYFYVPGRDPGSALTDLLTDITVKERGPLVASLLVESSPSGTNGFRREIRLVKGLDRVDIIDAINKKKVREKESIHIGFPFNIPQGVVRTDGGWEIVRPEIDQLPGSCKDYFSVQRWVDVSNKSRGITWTNQDAPLVEIGEMTNEAPNADGQRVWRRLILPAQNIYSYVMNNYWHTNYKADQEGDATFHYSVTPHDKFSATEAERIGIEQSQPLLVVPGNKRRATLPSLLSVEPSSVTVTSLKPSDDKKGFIVRLYNAGEDSVHASIHWNRRNAGMYYSSVFEDRGKEIVGPIPLPEFGIVTIRVEGEK